ncbi:MAG: hypothetical protein GSR86_01785 [Desulfurococcales archaeon]|nr:hypothetical protein [Desulfurococcales archaeon]
MVEVKSLGGGRYDIIIPGEDHTLGNLLAEKLSRMKEVKTAYYTVPHPLEDKIVVHLTIEEGDPVELLQKALDEIMEEAEEFINEYKRALKAKGVEIEEG